MKTMRRTQAAPDSELLSFSTVRKAFFACLILSIVFLLLGTAIHTYTSMKQTAKTIYQSASAQVSEKVDGSLSLLKSLASLEIFYDPDIPWEEKTAKLDQINEYYGYMFICYTDEDMVVYTLGEEPASLASREHMQKVYATKQPYVTDSFVAGADGKTLNYTVIVPLLKDGVMTGSLFATIVLDETQALLEEIVSATSSQAVLIGSKGQVMCSTDDLSYGASILDILRNYKLFSVTADYLEEQMLNRQAGSFQSYNNFNLTHTQYGPVEHANWDILVSVDFWALFSSMLPSVCFTLIGMAASMIMLFYFVNRHRELQSNRLQSMFASIQSIKKKMYTGNPLAEAEQLEYESILQMSSKGLNDELTGAFTRVIFLNQAELLIRNAQEGQILALCFIDLDDLKSLNDRYGHITGDAALKKIGSILREYAIKYDGLVGRYGGDEFILILRDLDSDDERNVVLQELVDRLKFKIRYEESEILIHCSVGASLWERDISLDTLISNADKALYDVKHHGKANFSVFLNGEHHEL